jgi:hypothetical protein
MSNIMLTGLGDEQLTVSSTGSLTLASIPHGAARVIMKLTDADIYMTNDAATASSSNGLLVREEAIINMTEGRYHLNDLRFIRAGSVDAKLHVMYFT